MIGSTETCVACGEQHEALKLSLDGVTVIVSCPQLTSVTVSGADHAEYGEPACLNPRCRICQPPYDDEPLDPHKRGLKLEGERVTAALAVVHRKVRAWLIGAGAFGVLVGFAVDRVLG